MADNTGTPRLKRKREGAESQRKKVRKHAASQPSNGRPGPDTPLKTPPRALTKPEIPSPPQTGLALTPPRKIASASMPTPTPRQPPNRPNSELLASDSSKPHEDGDKGQVEAASKTRERGPLVLKSEIDEAVAINAGKPDLSFKPEKKQKKQKRTLRDSWDLANAQGGWFLRHDTIFSPDESYVLLAKPKILEVYATESSLLTREFHSSRSAFILSYAISLTHPNCVYIADSAGIISLRDWTNGSRIAQWDIGANARHMAVVQQPDADQDLLFTHESGKRHVINVHALRTGAHASQTELKQIMKTKKSIIGIQVFHHGKIVVAISANSVMIGKRAKLQKTKVQDFEYTWREFAMSNPLTCFSAYVRDPTGSAKDKSKLQQTSRDNLDLAIGDSEGAIFLFEDVLSALAKIEQSQRDKSGEALSPEDLRPRRLHWHRNAVASVKWSLDGNYLVSGGKETVISIWQLSTGKQQFLPHLTAAIENIVISPSGASYALLLANNSVIILSTSELRALTNIVGVQSRRIDAEQLPRALSTDSRIFELCPTVPIVVDPKNHSQIIFTTPSSQPHNSTAGFYPEPYAQTYDIDNRRPVFRQALTRNNATEPNVDPDGRPIYEPHIPFVQISHDGEWLATVDEWLPPRSAMAHLDEGDGSSNDEELCLRREVYLKFWRRSENGSQWVLDARIDAPHAVDGASAHSRVLDLVSDPSAVGFATIGEDLVVRVWRPKTRTRDGLVIRGTDKKGLVIWSLNRSIGIPGRTGIEESEQSLDSSRRPQTCRLAFSADSSVLAAAVCWRLNEEPGAVHLLDADNSKLSRSITEIKVATLSGLGILGRYLIAVADTITIWDMVLDQLVRSIPIDTPGIDLAHRAQVLRLATNQADCSFAVSIPSFKKQKHSTARRGVKTSSTITIFKPDELEPLCSLRIREVVLAIVGAKDGSGYISLDAASNIHTISRKTIARQLPTPPPEDMVPGATNMDVADVKDESRISLQLAPSEALLQDFGFDKPVVTKEQLQDVFEGGSAQTLPPVRELFDAVAGLYARKPKLQMEPV